MTLERFKVLGEELFSGISKALPGSNLPGLLHVALSRSKRIEQSSA